MGILYSIGELLIDFIPLQKGKALKDVLSFEKAPGGAPANVVATVAKYGGKSSLITKLGEDSFGDFLLEELKLAGVCTDKIFRTKEANTGLAFVSLREDGERDFLFYHKSSSDLFLSESEINKDWFSKGDILHFCSVDLVESPMKGAHIKAIKSVKARGGLISFDPNVRLPLWNSLDECRNTILEFIPLSNIIKISNDELQFITGIDDVSDAIASLFKGDVKAVILTKGSKGSELYVGNEVYKSNGYFVKVQDTTGAGDTFIGGFLYQLLQLKANTENLVKILEKHHEDILSFANASGALTTTGNGVIPSIPSKKDIYMLLGYSL